MDNIYVNRRHRGRALTGFRVILEFLGYVDRRGDFNKYRFREMQISDVQVYEVTLTRI